ncbi:DUF6212 domain-containing protein [Paracoccus laeviglucosivorans]|uniref:Uncharacterized protein n=1 Tax=Paracoccus laeviglucosivorans TaxID=1197861 RepID=A0A521FNP0_9RHOB|nr:DUF6212 domain-containing protein [Paracoccus laeviglucosivorans]SMO97825.1 hypothetical protein SAMN06265221_1311 [Paracoccus laeviglucosivorans]
MSTLIVDARVQDIARRFLPESVEIEILDPSQRRFATERAIVGEVLGAVSLSGQKKALKAALSDGPFAKLEIFELDPDEPRGFSDSIIQLLLGELKSARRDIGEARMAAAQLRSESMGTKARLREIENLLYSLGNPQISNALTWQPTGKMLSLTAGQSVSQLLPINAVGLTAIDLWFPEVVMPMIEEFSVVLQDSSGRIYPTQVASPDMGLETGWLRFNLPEPIEGIGRDCHLRIEMADEGRLSLGLSQAVPDPIFRANGETGPLADEALALRAWQSLGGVRLPSCSPTISGNQAVSITESRFIPASSFPEPEVFSLPFQASDHVSTAHWEKEDAILVHPSRTGAVCAILRDVDMAGLSHISALVTVGHSRAPNLNFAIGVAPHGVVDEDGFWQRRMGPWVTGLPARGWAQAHCIPVEPITGRADLLLAVSLAADVPNDLSWGLFRGFRISRGILSDGGNS